MTTFTTRKNTLTVNDGSPFLSHNIVRIDPSALASYPGSTDVIEFFDIPAGVRVLGGFLSVSADIGASGSTVKLQALPSGGSTTDLTTTLSSEAVGSTAVIHTLAKQTVATTIQVVVGTAALDAAGNIEVMLTLARDNG